MKTKLNLEKFTVAKLINPEKISGGCAAQNIINGDNTQTDTIIVERPTGAGGTVTKQN